MQRDYAQYQQKQEEAEITNSRDQELEDKRVRRQNLLKDIIAGNQKAK